MRKYVDNVYLETEQCCNCGMTFAMTQDFMSRRVKDQKSFYCPSGHRQHYTGKTEVQKLKDRLDNKQRELERQFSATANLRVQRDSLSRSYGRIRDRVKNGVCPCCNRTFNNLMRHMQTKHPDFGSHDVLKTIRTLFGLSQAGLADEVGISVGHISKYENQKPVPEYAKVEIEQWVEDNG